MTKISDPFMTCVALNLKFADMNDNLNVSNITQQPSISILYTSVDVF